MNKIMGSKKKMAQAARREARQTYSEVAEVLREKLDNLEKVLKPRPKWMPRKIWRLFSKIFVDIDKLEKTTSGNTDDDFLNKVIKNY